VAIILFLCYTGYTLAGYEEIFSYKFMQEAWA